MQPEPRRYSGCAARVALGREGACVGGRHPGQLHRVVRVIGGGEAVDGIRPKVQVLPWQPEATI